MPKEERKSKSPVADPAVRAVSPPVAEARSKAGGNGYAQQAKALSPSLRPAATAHPKADALAEEARFKELFKAASAVRGADQGTMFRGGLGNVVTTLSMGGLGDGCSAWADWAFQWVSDNAAGFGITDFQQVHVTGMFNHNLVKVAFPSGREFALDPWRSAEDCVIPAADYIQAHGPMKPGFGSGKELAANYADGAAFGAKSLVMGRDKARQDQVTP